jgi:hypothetical protein
MKPLHQLSGYFRPLQDRGLRHSIEVDTLHCNGKALGEVFVEACHGLCTLHISVCKFNYEDIAGEHATCLGSIYMINEKWLEILYEGCVYIRIDVLLLTEKGMSNTAQLIETIKTDMEIHFKSDFDINRFFKNS